MVNGNNNKNSIDLNHYAFREDIQQRLFLSSLSAFELSCLREIVHGSLKFPITTLQDELEVGIDELTKALDHLGPSGLFTVASQQIQVSKERRRYFEAQVERLEDGFLPDLRYFRALLSKVPIEKLSHWYKIHDEASDLVHEIIHQHLITPQVFERYLNEIQFEDPTFHTIIDQVYRSDDYQVPTETLEVALGLTEEKFQEYLIHLEFNLILTEHFVTKDSGWIRMVTPFHEWREYLLFSKEAFPQPIHPQEIETVASHNHDIATMQKLLQEAALGRKNLAPNFSEKALSNIEQRLAKLEGRGWVLLDEFIDTLHIPLYIGEGIRLENRGKRYSYELPHYTEEEKEQLYPLFKERFVKTGLIALGSHARGVAIKHLRPLPRN